MCKITTATPAEKCYFYVLFNDQKHILGTVTRRTAEKTAHMMVKDYTRIKWSDRNVYNVETEALVMAGRRRIISIYAYRKGKGMPTTIVHL